MPMGYDEDFTDERGNAMEIRVDLYYDEINALITTVCNKWGWTEGERVANGMSVPLQAALAALYEAVEVDE